MPWPARWERGTVTGPTIFILFGLAAGPIGIGLLDLDINNQELRVIADLTLALILFIDAANANLGVLAAHAKIPRRMLLLGLPLCIALGTLCGVVIFPGLGFYELCVLATMLAVYRRCPGQGAVVTNKDVPERIREGLECWKVALMTVFVCQFFLFSWPWPQVVREKTVARSLALKLVAREIGIGFVVGIGRDIVCGKVAFCLLRSRLGLPTSGSRFQWLFWLWLVSLLPRACTAVGYIAAFCRRPVVRAPCQVQYPWPGLGGRGHRGVIGDGYLDHFWSCGYWSVLVPHVVVGGALFFVESYSYPDDPDGAFFDRNGGKKCPVRCSWPGLVRGDWPVLYLPSSWANENLEHESVLLNTVVCTVTLSVIAHGLTANPLSKAFARKLKMQT